MSRRGISYLWYDDFGNLNKKKKGKQIFIDTYAIATVFQHISYHSVSRTNHFIFINCFMVILFGYSVFKAKTVHDFLLNRSEKAVSVSLYRRMFSPLKIYYGMQTI